MRALTIQQPWAAAILHCGKKVENRSYPVSYRGPLALHAGLARVRLDREDPDDWPDLYGCAFPTPEQLHFGAVVGVCILSACLSVQEAQSGRSLPWLADHPFLEGPYAWVLDNVVALREPVLCRGEKGLWTLSGPVLAKVHQQLKKEGV